MQHHRPLKVECIGHAVNPAWLLPRLKQLETRNWEISDVSVFKTTLTEKIRFELSSNSEFQVGNSDLFLELQPEDHWSQDSTLFLSEFPKCLESTKNPEKDRLWWQSLTTKFADEGPLHHFPVQVSTAQQGESKNVLYAAA